MKRIIALVVGIGLVASLVGAQTLGVGFARAIDSGEDEISGVVLSARLVSVLGNSLYVIRSSEGETAYVNAENGRVSKVESAGDDEVGRRGRGRMGDLGALLEAVEATIDWQRIIDAASSESGRDDIHAVTLNFAGGKLASNVAFGSPLTDDVDPEMVAVDPETYTVVESFGRDPRQAALRGGFAPNQRQFPTQPNGGATGRGRRTGGPGMGSGRR